MTAVVPTRNRPDQIVPCVASILANAELHELVVVDQSDDDRTQVALSAITDPRLRYHRSDTRGVCAARNLGIEHSTGEIIASTDDDCRVPVDWVRRYAAIFAAEPEAAVVCGRVEVPDELLVNGGFAAEFEPTRREWKRRFPALTKWGITANLAVRRSVYHDVGPYDPFLGAGSVIGSGGEPDFLYRVIRSGRLVLTVAEVEVAHLGVRQFGPETRELLRRYRAGTSAAFMKHVRSLDPIALLLCLRYLAALVAVVPYNLVTRRRPTGIGELTDFVSGARRSFQYRVDRPRRMYTDA